MPYDQKLANKKGCAILKRKLILALILTVSLTFGTFGTAMAVTKTAAAVKAVKVTSQKTVQLEGNWAPATLQAMNNLIAKNGKNSPSYNPNKKPYAVFDWDNTCCYADTEEHTLIYQLENLKYKMTPDEFRTAFTTGNNAPIPTTDFVDPYKNEDGKSVNITKIADDVCNDYKYFWDNYKGLNPNAANSMTLTQIKNTDQFKDFEAKFWFTYSAMDSTFGYDISWTWLLNFFAGYTPDEAKALATEAVLYSTTEKIQNDFFDSPLAGEAGIIKNSDPNIDNYFRQGLRATPEMESLMHTLRANGIDVYVCSASLDSVIRGFASSDKFGYNVPDENVIGMKLNVTDNKYVPSIPDTNTYAINAKHGKAVNINNILAQKKGYNPILIGGDSDGDYEMMTELSGFNKVTMLNNFSPLQMVLLINRVKGGNFGALCKIAASQMGMPNPSLVLQGRDENTGSWVPYESTLRLGKTSYQLVK